MKKNKVFSIILSVTLLSSGQSFCSGTPYGGNIIGYYFQRPDWIKSLSNRLPSRQAMIGVLSLGVAAFLAARYVYQNYVITYDDIETKIIEAAEAKTDQQWVDDTKEMTRPHCVKPDLENLLADSNVVNISNVYNHYDEANIWREDLNEYRPIYRTSPPYYGNSMQEVEWWFSNFVYPVFLKNVSQLIGPGTQWPVLINKVVVHYSHSGERRASDVTKEKVARVLFNLMTPRPDGASGCDSAYNGRIEYSRNLEPLKKALLRSCSDKRDVQKLPQLQK